MEVADLEPSVRARSIIVQIFTLFADSFGHFVRCGRNRLVSGRRVTACLLLEFAGGLAHEHLVSDFDDLGCFDETSL